MAFPHSPPHRKGQSWPRTPTYCVRWTSKPEEAWSATSQAPRCTRRSFSWKKRSRVWDDTRWYVPRFLVARPRDGRSGPGPHVVLPSPHLTKRTQPPPNHRSQQFPGRERLNRGLQQRGLHAPGKPTPRFPPKPLSRNCVEYFQLFQTKAGSLSSTSDELVYDLTHSLEPGRELVCAPTLYPKP